MFFYFLMKRKPLKIIKSLFYASLLLSVAFTMVSIYYAFFYHEATEKTLEMMRLSTEKLGSYLASRCKGAKALILTDVCVFLPNHPAVTCLLRVSGKALEIRYVVVHRESYISRFFLSYFFTSLREGVFSGINKT